MLPADFWENERRMLAAVIRGRLTQASMLGVMDGSNKLSQVNLFFDNALAHEEAARWARQHTDQLLQQFGTTTRNGVSQILQNWIQTPGATMGDLEDMLMPFLDNNLTRANTTATTEVTRAYAQGNDIAFQQVDIPAMLMKPPLHVNCRCSTAVKRIRSKNAWVAVWYTNNDELVCTRSIQTILGRVDGCSAMHNRIISGGEWFGKKFSEAG